MRTVRIEVFGRVQGVFFRVLTKDFCDRTGLSGRVMNCRDGSVLVLVQGKSDQIDLLRNWLKSSPGMSKVERLNEKVIEFRRFKGFKIVRTCSFFYDKARSWMNLSKRFFSLI